MLKWMRLKNLALVDKADMEFGPGFNVITGETGAGKSVIMGGVGLLLGGRADKSAIRIGTDRCEVSGEFFVGDGSASRVKAILDEAGIESDPAGNLLVRRVITASSSRNFVNESPVTLQILHRIGEVLVDIHGASENHQLLKNQNQLDMLDRFGRLDAELAEVRAVWSELAKLRQEKKSFAESMPSAEETARFRRDAAEIEKAAPVSGEDEELEARHTVAAHSKSIIEVALTAANALSECEDSLADRVGQVRRMLGDLEKFDPDHAEQFIRAIEEISAQVMSLSGYRISSRQHRGAFFDMETYAVIGSDEQDALTRISYCAGCLSSRERAIRSSLQAEDSDRLSDRVSRAYGVLKYSMLLTFEEFMQAASDIRLGIALGIIKDMDYQSLGKLIIDALPKSIKPSGDHPKEKLRAELVRSRLSRLTEASV